MKKAVLFVLLIPMFASSIFAQSTRIVIISDTHYLSTKLAVEGDALFNFEKATGRYVNIMHEVLDKALNEIVAEKPDVLLISGDMTNHGEKQSHLDFVKKLSYIEKLGINVMVVPGNHDINIPNAKSYYGAKSSATESISEIEFGDIYNNFGYGQSLKRDSSSLSYVAEIDKDTWLLAVDTNRYKENKNTSISAGRISSSTLQWALDVLKEANEKEILVIGMMHHGLVEHLPYQSIFFSDYLVDNWERNASILADAGLQVVFTGHFHANDVTMYTSPAGNKLFDIETGSLAAYPFPYRIVDINNKSLSINTYRIESVKSEPNLQEEYKLKYEQIARRAIGARIKNIGIPLSDKTSEVVVDLLTRMSLLHAVGDETISYETYKIIEKFANVMGDDTFDISTFSLDYPPADNTLTIELK